ncbi:MAG TPA: CaiB/BaiF CoA-transferase family protein [Steroidobacteraceae bacterium]|nr:CaiB/BaiF CoA-transferase family protein [Steroidobacteraceae bacterium]
MKLPERVSGPLQGVRVVELAALGPAPFCAMLLADMGADILRIAPPPRGAPTFPVPEREDPLWRGRSRLTLDLKDAGDRARLMEILRYADVMIEGFRPAVLERLGIGPDACLAANPRLVVGRMTGWGQSGPLAQAPGHDPNYLALTGALHAIGPRDRPPCVPLNLVADFGGGALYLAMGVLAALLHVRGGGAGQVVDAAMVDGVASLMGMVYTLRNHGLWSDERGSNLLDGGAPFGSTYETADGKYVVVCALEPPFYRALLAALGLDERTLPPRDERSSWPVLREKFATAFKSKTRAEWTRLLEGTDACVTPVLTLGEAPEHPHNRARGVFLGEPPTPAAAPRFSVTRTAHAPTQGPQPAELLARWGMDSAAARAIAAPASVA